MAETMGTIMQRLADWLDADDQERFPTSIRGWCVNEARRNLIRTTHMRWGEQSTTEALTTGDYSFAMPSGFLTPTKLWYLDSDGDVVELDKISKDQYDLAFPDTTETGTLRYYCVYGTTIYVNPTDADVTLYLDYYGLVDDLDPATEDDTDTFLDEAQEAIFWSSLLLANDFLQGEESRRQLWQEKAQLAELKLLTATARAKSPKDKSRPIPGHIFR